MRHALIPIVLSAVILAGAPSVAGAASGQAAPPPAAAADAAQNAAFLKTLQSAVAVGNCLKVATLVEFPLKAWANGEPITIETESEFHAKYRQVFTADVKKAIADARPETLTVGQDGIMFDGGRIVFRPIAARKNALRVVAINDSAQPR